MSEVTERAAIREKLDEARGNEVRNGKVRFRMNRHSDTPVITFRVPDFIDVARLDKCLPVLPADEKTDKDSGDDEAKLLKIFEDPERCERFFERADQMLMWLALSPQLVPETRLEDEEGFISVREITSLDRAIVFQALLGLAGYSGEATAEVVPFVKVDESSESSMPSDNDTAVDPVTSSVLEDDGTSSSE